MGNLKCSQLGRRNLRKVQVEEERVLKAICLELSKIESTKLKSTWSQQTQSSNKRKVEQNSSMLGIWRKPQAFGLSPEKR